MSGNDIALPTPHLPLYFILGRDRVCDFSPGGRASSLDPENVTAKGKKCINTYSESRCMFVSFPRLIAAIGGALHLVPRYCQYGMSLTKNRTLPMSVISLFLSVFT